LDNIWKYGANVHEKNGMAKQSDRKACNSNSRNGGCDYFKEYNNFNPKYLLTEWRLHYSLLKIFRKENRSVSHSSFVFVFVHHSYYLFLFAGWFSL
jgi:hypothetical protein